MMGALNLDEEFDFSGKIAEPLNIGDVVNIASSETGRNCGKAVVIELAAGRNNYKGKVIETEWIPTETPSPFNEMLDQWVDDGMPQNTGKAGWFGFVVVAMSILLILFLLYLFFTHGLTSAWHIPPVSTPDRVW